MGTKKIIKLKPKITINPLIVITIIYFIYINEMPRFCFIFLMVFIHELSHFFVAALKGYEIETIEIMPFGTVLRFKSYKIFNSLDEIIISISGPAYNILMGTVLLLLGADIFFIAANFVIGFFNLIPIFPLDGGRILRAILMRNNSYIVSTKIVCKLSEIICVAGVLIALVNCSGNYYSAFIALIFIFILITINNEKGFSSFAGIIELHKRTGMIEKEEFLKANQIVCVKSAKAKDIVKEFLPEKYNIVYVLNEESIISDILTETVIIENLHKLNYNCTIEEIAESEAIRKTR